MSGLFPPALLYHNVYIRKLNNYSSMLLTLTLIYFYYKSSCTLTFIDRLLFYFRSILRTPCFYVFRHLNEQVAYKRGVAGPKKWRPELIIVKMAVQQRLRLHLCFGHRLLAIVCQVFFFLKDIKTVRCIWLLWRHFCISRIQIDEAIASTTCTEAKKEALARRILHVCQLLTPPGTCLIDNATLLIVMCDALLP